MSRGADRERACARILRREGWASWTTKNDGLEPEDKRFSHGIVDVVAVQQQRESPLPEHKRYFRTAVRLIQVKSTRHPYEHFGPADRAALLAEAVLAGASAELWHWPKHAREPRIIASAEWPAFREDVAA